MISNNVVFQKLSLYFIKSTIPIDFITSEVELKKDTCRISIIELVKHSTENFLSSAQCVVGISLTRNLISMQPTLGLFRMSSTCPFRLSSEKQRTA